MGFLGFSILYLSYAGSINIVEEGIRDGVKKISGCNNKFDYKSFIKDKIKNRDFKGLGSLLPLIVPIVDLMYAPILASEINDNMNEEYKKYIIPVFNDDNNIEVVEEQNIIKQPKRIFINNKPLKGKYTIDEIEMLNDTTGYLYKIGTINSEYVAIIGNYNQEPYEDHKTQIVEFLFEEDIKEYNFQPKNEHDERLKDKLFKVYSLTYNEELEECSKNIIIERIKKQKEELIKIKEDLIEEEIEDSKVLIKK